jgi:hypothetical protein
MAQTGFTPIVTYNTATATTVPSAANLAQGELAVNVTDKKLYTKDSGGNVVLLASNGGDVTGPASSTNLAIPTFSGTGGKTLLDNAGATISAGVITATGFSGPLTGNVTGNVSGSSGSCTGNAATVTTNANLTGPITSVGNATSIASQTGTGTKFVVDTSPTLVTPTATTTIGVGGATPSASGAGITFPATQSASTDANTLDDYEEGTWTPNQGSGLVVVGAFSSSGAYTKIGRLVTVTGILFGATSIATGVGGLISTNLPFALGAGNAVGRCVTSSWLSGTDIIPSVADLYSATATTANTYIFFSVTYQTA